MLANTERMVSPLLSLPPLSLHLQNYLMIFGSFGFEGDRHDMKWIIWGENLRPAIVINLNYYWAHLFFRQKRLYYCILSTLRFFLCVSVKNVEMNRYLIFILINARSFLKNTLHKLWHGIFFCRFLFELRANFWCVMSFFYWNILELFSFRILHTLICFFLNFITSFRFSLTALFWLRITLFGLP